MLQFHGFAFEILKKKRESKRKRENVILLFFYLMQGIKIINCIAAGLDLIVLLIWGIHFALRTQNDIAIRDTIVGQFVSYSSLGYSYW